VILWRLDDFFAGNDTDQFRLKDVLFTADTQLEVGSKICARVESANAGRDSCQVPWPTEMHLNWRARAEESHGRLHPIAARSNNSKGTFSMNVIIGKLAQTGAALWILTVWFFRFNKDTGYRGGDATNMKEEFAEYGMSEKTMYAVGATKVALATAMLVGHRVPKLVRPASAGLATLMVGAIGMHVKVKDPIKRSLPAISVLTMSAISAWLNRES